MAFKSKQTGKTYKNVYTILEKVKKGEIQSYYNDGDGLFGKIKFYEKPDLVKPNLHYIDESRLGAIVHEHLNNSNNVTQMYNHFAATPDFRKLNSGITPTPAPNLNDFYKKFQENFKKFPAHLQNDIFKLYYNKMDNVDFAERTDKNYTKFKFLERSNNPVGKIMSESSNLKSAIFTRNLMLYYLTRLTMLSYTDPDAAKQMMKSLGGSGGGGGDIDDLMKDMFDSKDGKKMMDDAIQQASDLCKAMDQNMSDDVQDQMFNSVNKGGEGAAKLSTEYFKQMTGRLEKIRLSMGPLKDKIQKLLDKTASYFSARKEITYEDLFNSDNPAGIEDIELLHPLLRKAFIEDINVRETKNIGKIDVYVDVSGSMDDHSGVKTDAGANISKLEFAKSMIAKLIQMNMLNDVYLFNNYVKKYKNDLLSVAMIDSDGGTSLDAPVYMIQKNQRNALVITDAEDDCSVYSEYAFFIGVKGSRFHYFEKNTMKKYSENNQAVVFDGKSIQYVNEKGGLGAVSK